MKKPVSTIGCVFAALGLAILGIGASSAAESAAAKTAAAATAKAAPTRVQVVTSLGKFTIELNEERAPLTVANFLKYVDQGQYTGTIFHRAIPNFVIQGGGYDTDLKLKPAAIKTFNESGNGLTNQRGTVGMARGPEPHSGDCQFYINVNDNSALDPSQARWGYAVFGKVVDGMDVADHISTQATGAKGPFKDDSPLELVVIEKIERVPTP
jgi:peptidyl-prolyl cis-trans isomerase A (cyclophilin A)/peptidyl-prolyl cis-trans isomerase B (cyclophilin B)